MDPSTVRHVDPGVGHGTYQSYDDLTPTSIHDSDIPSVYGDSANDHIGRHGTATGSIRRIFSRLAHRRKTEIHSKSNLLHTSIHHDHDHKLSKNLSTLPTDHKQDGCDRNKHAVMDCDARDGCHGNVETASHKSSPSTRSDILHTPVVTLGSYLLGIYEQFNDTLALIENKTDMTFRELSLLIEKLCHALDKRHFGHGHVLCYVSNNATYLVVFLCAVTLLGGIIIPLDPNYHVDLLPVVLSEHRVRLIVTEQDACRYVQKTAWRAKLYRAVYCIGHCRGARSISELISMHEHKHIKRHHTLHTSHNIDPKFDTAVIFYRKTQNGNSCKSSSFTHYSLIVNILQVGTLVTDGVGTVSLVCNPQNTHWRRLIGSLLASLVKGHTLVVTHGTCLTNLCQTMKQCSPQLLHVDPVLLDGLLRHESMKQFDWSLIDRIFCVVEYRLVENLHKLHQDYKAVHLFGHPDSMFTHYSTGTCAQGQYLHYHPLPRTRCKIVDNATGHHMQAGNTGQVWVRGPQLSIHHNHAHLYTVTYDCYGWLNIECQGHIDAQGHLYLNIHDVLMVTGL